MSKVGTVKSYGIKTPHCHMIMMKICETIWNVGLAPSGYDVIPYSNLHDAMFANYAYKFFINPRRQHNRHPGKIYPL